MPVWLTELAGSRLRNRHANNEMRAPACMCLGYTLHTRGREVAEAVFWFINRAGITYDI